MLRIAAPTSPRDAFGLLTARWTRADLGDSLLDDSLDLGRRDSPARLGLDRA
jgi:hypothetical protein